MNFIAKSGGFGSDFCIDYFTTMQTDFIAGNLSQLFKKLI
jgi:hypothetical protein